jgi:hypothetical protein
MSDDPRVAAPVEALIRAVAGGSGAKGDERAMTFARGLALGALVGAAIAGSTIWQRRQARRQPPDTDPIGRDATNATGGGASGIATDDGDGLLPR